MFELKLEPSLLELGEEYDEKHGNGSHRHLSLYKAGGRFEVAWENEKGVNDFRRVSAWSIVNFETALGKLEDNIKIRIGRKRA